MTAHGYHLSPVLIVVSCLLSGCTTAIFPPRTVTEPARIGVLDHGRHSSLIMEIPGEPAMIRYAYGDWQWYALKQTSVTEATSAIFWPTRAGLGRKRIAGPFSPDAVLRGVRAGIEDAIYIEVEADAVRALIKQLDEMFVENMSTRIYNAAYDLKFVHHPDAYWVFHNSNHVVGQWLEALGCRIEGPAVLSNWQRSTDTGR